MVTNLPSFADQSIALPVRVRQILLLCALLLAGSQAWLASWGLEQTEPLFQLTGHTLGQHACHAAFGILGFYALSCLESCDHPPELLFQIAFRVLGALAASVLAVFCLLGPWLAHMPLHYYLADPLVWQGMAHTLLMLDGSASLPYAFDANMMAGVVMINMPLLATATGALSLLYLSTLTAGMSRLDVLTGILCVLCALCVFLDEKPDMPAFLSTSSTSVRLLTCLVLGMTAWRLRTRLRLNPVLMMALWCITILLAQTSAFLPLLLMATVYSALGLMLVLPYRSSSFFAETDLSLGIFLYSWPLQQAIQSRQPFISPELLAMQSICFGCACAVISWRVVEVPLQEMAGRWTSSRLKTHPTPRGLTES